MSIALIIDVVLAIAVMLALWIGWRQGAISSALSAVGIISGLIISLGILSFILRMTTSVLARFFLALFLTIMLAGSGNAIGALLGHGIRDRMKNQEEQAIDSALGSAFRLVAILAVSWLISIPVASGLGGKVATGIGDSQILRGVDKLMPDRAKTLPTQVSALLDQSGLPPLISPFESAHEGDVAPPDEEIHNQALVDKLRPSIIHVMASSQQCHRRLLGSGFVIADDFVVTNAHVVAGTDTVRLDTVLGLKSAQVVAYDPQRDIAVLHAPGLNIKPLEWANENPHSGDSAMVMGFPGSGPFDASPARIAQHIKISGTDIYARGRYERDVYSVRGSIREGNSGGPLLNDDGDVLGVVFGASRDQSDIGFALSEQEVRPMIENAVSKAQPVETQQCVAY